MHMQQPMAVSQELCVLAYTNHVLGLRIPQAAYSMALVSSVGGL